MKQSHAKQESIATTDTPIARSKSRRIAVSRVVLREELVELIADLRAKKITPQLAKEAANMVGKVWAGERLALDYYEARKEKPPRIAFIEAL